MGWRISDVDACEILGWCAFLSRTVQEHRAWAHPHFDQNVQNRARAARELSNMLTLTSSSLSHNALLLRTSAAEKCIREQATERLWTWPCPSCNFWLCPLSWLLLHTQVLDCLLPRGTTRSQSVDMTPAVKHTDQETIPRNVGHRSMMVSLNIRAGRGKKTYKQQERGLKSMEHCRDIFLGKGDGLPHTLPNIDGTLKIAWPAPRPNHLRTSPQRIHPMSIDRKRPTGANGLTCPGRPVGDLRPSGL